MIKSLKYIILSILIISVANPILNTAPFGKPELLEPFFFGDVIAVISNYYNNKNYPTIVSLRYNQKIDEKNRITDFIEIYFNDYLNRACITLTTRDRKKILKLIDNVLNAIKGQTGNIDKDIGDLNVGISWKKGDDEWIETENNKMLVKVTTGIDKKYQMTVSFSEGVSQNAKYKPGVLYLNEESINKLKTILDDDNYNSFLNKAKSK